MEEYHTWAGLPWSGQKVWKMTILLGQGKVREFQFQSGKFRKNEKSQGKVREFKNFPKKVHCLQASEKYNFYKLQAVYFHNSHGMRCSFINYFSKA